VSAKNDTRERVLTTDRLVLDRLAPDDAPFIFELVNDPSWIRFIGDKGVRTLDDARAYLEKGPMASYVRFGFGLYRTSLRADASPIGICGLIRRDTLTDVDVGFALLPRYCGRGYAREAVRAVVELGRDAFGLTRIVAITTPDNAGSIGVLESSGFSYERNLRIAGDDAELALYALEWPRPEP